MSTTGGRFIPASTKITIQCKEPTTTTVEAQYNPKEIQVDKAVPWQKVNQANRGNAQGDAAAAGAADAKSGKTATNNAGNQGIHLEFTGAEGRTMTLELLFDGVESSGRKVDVPAKIKDLEKMAAVIKPGSDNPKERRPPICMVAWGNVVSFCCVIEALSTKYTMFSSDGTPLRATVTIKLREADYVSEAQPDAPQATNPPSENPTQQRNRNPNPNPNPNRR